MKVEVTEAMLEEAGVLEEVAFGQLLECLRRLNVIANAAHRANEPDHFLLRCVDRSQQRHQRNETLPKFERVARRVLRPVGNEVFADSGEEVIELVAKVAFERVGVKIELDQKEDDALVLPLHLLEKSAHDRSAHLLVGAQQL